MHGPPSLVWRLTHQPSGRSVVSPAYVRGEASRRRRSLATANHEETMHSRHQRKGGQWWFLLSLAALWLIGSAARVASPTAANNEAMTPAGTGTQSPPRDQAVAALETYQGTPVGFTADGYPFRGNPNAPLTLVEYSDYLCPFCGGYFRQTLPALLEHYGRTGQVQFVFHDFP